LPCHGLSGGGKAERDTGLGRTLGQKSIQDRTTHNPERGLPWKLGPDRILKGPREAHLLDDLVDHRGEVKRKPTLHRGGHATAAGLAPTRLLPLEKEHISPPIGEVESGGTASRTRANDDGVAGPKRHGKWDELAWLTEDWGN
jgi:hypothetical protein